ncbi:phosphatase PAP2 family protein [Nocardioides solisilvae]|uniref:phosphatase PAP2 family protein n=1 Tax=Nocardioides solisilvae TaxID=1542435 RepID=UPI000D749441|nr:phosphatase PAP2 family protein [Nocardioides solisilvae]
MTDVRTAPAPARLAGWRAALLELGLVAGLYLLYRWGRVVALDREAVALANARAVHDLQQAVGLPSEAVLQALVPSVGLLELANVYYVAVHFPTVVAFLAWLYLLRPRADYLWARNLLVVQTGLAAGIHVAFPLAPPRMFADLGFVDTMSVHGPSAYDGASAAVANQYAAMPSLHVGWAVLLAVVVSRCGPRWAARLTGAHAATTLVVVTVTANHWLLDGAVAVLLLGLALLAFPGPDRRRPGHLRLSRPTAATAPARPGSTAGAPAPPPRPAPPGPPGGGPAPACPSRRAGPAR